MRILLSVVLLLLAGTAEATCRARVVVKEAVVVKEVAAVVKEVVVAQFVPLAVAVPAYAVGYAPAAYPAAVAPAYSAAPPAHPVEGQSHATAKAACEDRLAALERKFAALEQLRSETQVERPAVAQAANSGLAIGQLFAAKCASCHEANVSKEKGGGLTLLKGGALVDLTPEQVNKVMVFTYSAKMPKKPAGMSEADFQKQKLNDQDFAAIMDWASSKTKK